MKTIGLTGGSGCGKGYISEMFELRGIPCLDTDLVSRAVASPGHECLVEIVNAFGIGILNPDGTMNRAALRDIVFDNDELRRELNSITHKHILNECRKWLAKKESEGYKAAVIDAPLLYESGFNKECDAIIAVIADTETRISRIVKRDGIDKSSAIKRISSQHSNDFFCRNSDYIITNNSDTEKDELKRAVDEILNEIGV